MSDYQPLSSGDGNKEGSDPELRPGDHGDWKANVADLGKKFGETVSVVGGKLTEGVGAMGEKMKEIFYTPTLADRMVEEATSEVLIGPDLTKGLQICDLVNDGRFHKAEVIKAIKRRLAQKNGHVQLLALTLLEMALKNCADMFPEVANEKVLDVMVRIVDDPTTPVILREKCLRLIEAWGEATDELRFLPVFEETYKSLKHRGIVFPPRDAESLAPIFTPPASGPAATARAGGGATGLPGYFAPPLDHAVPPGLLAWGGAGGVQAPGVSHFNLPQGPLTVLDSKEILSVARNSMELLSTVLSSAPPEEVVKDEVTISLTAQCRVSKASVQQLIEAETSNEALLFEALAINDELDKVLDKVAEIRKQVSPPPAAAPTPAAGTSSASTEQSTDVLAPPPPVMPFAVPVGSSDSDGGEALLRRRPGAEPAADNSAATSVAGAAPGAAGTGALSEDERALAELDAMVFGKSSASATTATGATGEQATHGAASVSSGHGEKNKKEKDDDLIVF